MANTYRIMFLFAAALTFSGGAQAQNQIAVQADAQVETSAEVAPPLSITQRYVRGPRTARAPLQLLIDPAASASSQEQVLAQVDAPGESPRGAMTGDIVVTEVGTQPAINALGTGRLAITVSTAGPVSTTAVSATPASATRVYHGPRPGRWVSLSTQGDRHE